MLIKIQNLRLKTKIGVYEWEKNFEREIIINIEIEVLNNKSSISDDLQDTVDYDKIYKIIKFEATNSSFNLIEKLAGKILEEIMKDERIASAKIELQKMHVFEDVESFSICLEQKRN